MELTTANFLTEMRGPVFLQFYASVICVVLLFCWWRIRRSDPTRNLEPPQVPARPDPYEIACLRGGVNEVARLMALSLVERGYLELDEESSKIRRNNRTRDGEGPLTPEEARLVEWCGTGGSGRSAKELFFTGGPIEVIKPLAERYGRRFDQEQLVLDQETKTAGRQVAVAGILVILTIGLVKLTAAIAAGRRNIGFLILFMIVGCIGGALIGWRPKLSSRGKRYLERLRMAFSDLREGTYVPRPVHAEAGYATSAMLLGAGVFGLAVLEGGAYDRFRKMYARSAGDGGSSAGCGSYGSGSSGDGGSGCGGGGGCGGCGGGD